MFVILKSAKGSLETALAGLVVQDLALIQRRGGGHSSSTTRPVVVAFHPRNIAHLIFQSKKKKKKTREKVSVRFAKNIFVFCLRSEIRGNKEDHGRSTDEPELLWVVAFGAIEQRHSFFSHDALVFLPLSADNQSACVIKCSCTYMNDNAPVSPRQPPPARRR